MIKWDLSVVYQLLISFGITGISTVTLLAASILVIQSDTSDCGTIICACASWAVVISAVMSINLVIGSWIYIQGRKLAREYGAEDAAPLIEGRGQSAPQTTPLLLQALMKINSSASMFFLLLLLYFCLMSLIFWDKQADVSAVVFFIMSCASAAAAEFYTFIIGLKFTSTDTRNKNKMLLFATNLFLLALGITLFVVNTTLVHEHAHNNNLDKWVFYGMISVGVVCIISSVAGLFITGITYSHLSEDFMSSTALPLPYLFIELTCLGTCLFFTFTNACTALIVELSPSNHDILAVLALNFALGVVVCIATVIIHKAYGNILNPVLPSRYIATEVDIKKLGEASIKQWSSRINSAYGTKYIGAWDGDAALSLISTYTKMLTGGADSDIPHVKGVLLRIHTRDGGDDADTKDTTSDVEAKGEDDGTAALVFLTIVEKFDLTRYIPGCFGRCLARMFGAHGCIPLLSLRWGLVGFQWPFHSGIFMMKPSTAAKDEMTQIQRALVSWNHTSDLSCDVLMSPCMITQADSLAFEGSGFLNLPLGPSVLVDLRRYKGMAYKEFQRAALKKGNRRNHHDFFVKHGGTTHISRDFDAFDVKYPNVASSLTDATARQRAAKGELPIFCPVTPGAVQAMSEEHNRSFRRAFGVRVGGKPAGYATLFEFPGSGLITSDMQGLRHSLARPTRAYFAMLAQTVELALNEGYDFLDLGPTTLEPKLDVGGRLIECRAGYHTRSMVMRTLLKQGTDNFRSLQEEVETRLSEPGAADAKTTVRAHELPFVEEDFQVCTPDIISRYNVQPRLVTFKELQSERKEAKEPERKKSKKQLNKERRKAARKAAKRARLKTKRDAEARATTAAAGGAGVAAAPAVMAPSPNPTMEPTLQT